MLHLIDSCSRSSKNQRLQPTPVISISYVTTVRASAVQSDNSRAACAKCMRTHHSASHSMACGQENSCDPWVVVLEKAAEALSTSNRWPTCLAELLDTGEQ